MADEANLTLPLITISATSTDVANLSFPALSTWTISASTGTGGDNTFPALSTWVIDASTGAGGVNSLPALSTWGLTIYTGPGADITLPALSTWTLDVVCQGDAVADIELPLFTTQAVLNTGITTTADVTIPALVVDAYAGSYVLLEVPITLESSGLAGTVADMALHMPSLSVVISTLTESTGVADLIRPSATLSAAGLAENTGSVSEVLRLIRLVSDGVIGYAGQVSLELPAIILNADTHTGNTATASNDVLSWYVSATAFSAIAAAYHAWALNVRNAALSEYSGVEFNSFGVFRGRVMAAGTTGLHVVGEADLDSTTNIAALIRTATTDFGTSYNKRVPRAYVGMKAAQDMEFRTITSHDGARAYLIPRNGNTEVQQRRAPIGRGPKSRFWQFELANRDGGDFTAFDILVYPEVSGRRVV